jgi:hypothetical protein
MDTTADAYLYAGVRMMGEFYRSLDNALLAAIVQLAGAGLGAWWLSERWQRWRQRREFQYRTLVTFSERSSKVIFDLTRMASLVEHASMESEAKKLTILAELTDLLSLDAECRLLFEDPAIVAGLERLSDLFSGEATDWTRASLEKKQKRLRTERLDLVTRMGREMGFNP